ncbi:MAG: hypothetical protein ABIV21_09385 [Pyrinomonadaceae bacterium]
MKLVSEIQSTSIPDRADPAIKRRSILRYTLFNPLICFVVAAIGIFGGISSLFAGLACVLIHTLISSDKVFDRTGTVFLIFAIPAILVGSIFADEIKPKK